MLTPTDLFAFGNTKGPQRPRPGKSMAPDSAGMVGPEPGFFQIGPSLFADIGVAPLTGPYHLLPQGTELPSGLAVIADGNDVVDSSPFPAKHYTLYPTIKMTQDEFVNLFLSLPWKLAGKK